MKAQTQCNFQNVEWFVQISFSDSYQIHLWIYCQTLSQGNEDSMSEVCWNCSRTPFLIRTGTYWINRWVFLSKKRVWIGSNWLPNIILGVAACHSQLTTLSIVFQGLITKETQSFTIVSDTLVKRNIPYWYLAWWVRVYPCKCAAEEKQYMMLGFLLKRITIPGIPD